MNASHHHLPPHSRNEDFHVDIAATPFADQRAYHHHGIYDTKMF